MGKRIYLTLALIFVFTNLVHAADPNLVSHWPFDTDANDSAGNNDGTLMDNAAIVADAERGQVLGLDGSGDYVNLGNDSSIKPPLPVTLCTWVKLNSIGNYQWIMALDNTTFSYYGIWFYVRATNDLSFSYGDGGGKFSSNRRSAVGNTTLNVDTWYHLAVVINGPTDMKLYINGADDGPLAYSGTGGALAYSAGDSFIGSDVGSQYYLDGKIDDVRIYDRALDAAEVFQLYYFPVQAHFPDPFNGAEIVDLNTVLSWIPGEYADLHDVYFGTDFNDVNDADTTIYNPNDVYKGRQDPNSWDPCGLDFGTTYFWRIDEVNDPCVWPGDVWSFTTESGIATLPSPVNGATFVDSNVVLNWMPGKYADLHDVYFGTDFNDVNDADTTIYNPNDVYKGRQDINSWDPCGLDLETTYFWRIDEVNDACDPCLWPGDVWSFKIWVDPNLVGWWPFDTDANDYSSGGNDGTLNGDANLTADLERGQVLGLDGSGDYVEVPNDNSISLLPQGSISAWFKAASSFAGDARLISNDAASGNQGDSTIIFRNGDQTVDFYVYGETSVESTTTISPDRWYHIVVTWDGTNKKMYIDSSQEPMVTANSGPVLNSVSPLYIGAVGTSQYFNGRIDDVRIYDKSLSAVEVFQLYQLQIATLPSPVNGATLVDPNVILSWSPGKYVDLHDVYFGTNFDDVNDADTTIYNPNDVYKGRHDPNSWDPCGLDVETTYFWRIDEVNDTNVWRGNIWSFRTSSPVIELSTDSFFFWADWDMSENPDDQILTIHNSGPGTLNWQITEDCDWLTVTPLSGSSTGQPNDVILSVDIAGLPEDHYQCELTVSDPNANNDPQVVNVGLAAECMTPDHETPDYTSVGGWTAYKDYNDWVAVGKPGCWCASGVPNANPRQCWGDADEFAEGRKKYWVGVQDLTVLLDAWAKPYIDYGWERGGIQGQTTTVGTSPPIVVPQICADFDHFQEGRKRYRVYAWDLNILLSNWQQQDLPEPNCP